MVKQVHSELEKTLSKLSLKIIFKEKHGVLGACEIYRGSCWGPRWGSPLLPTHAPLGESLKPAAHSQR